MNRPAVLLECGVLPGLRQTSVRAELYAVMRAVRFACCRGLELMIWSDCQAVVRRLRRILQGAAVRINSPNADLWMMIADDISAGAHVQITKVKAHCTVSSANSPLEEWCYLHNQFADRAAVRANESRGEEFWLLLARHATACRSVDEWNSCIQQVLIAISRRVLCHERMTDSPEPSPSVPGPPPKWTALPPMPSPPKGAVRWYGEGLVMKLLKWFWHAVQCEPGPVVWISHAQMYIDFALTTGEAGPVHINGWRDSADMPLHALLHTGFKTRARWFGKVLRETLRHANVDVVAGYSVPTSHMIHMHCSCLGVPWDPGRLDAVDRWLMKFSKTPFRRQTKELDRLPEKRRQLRLERKKRGNAEHEAQELREQLSVLVKKAGAGGVLSAAGHLAMQGNGLTKEALKVSEKQEPATYCKHSAAAEVLQWKRLAAHREKLLQQEERIIEGNKITEAEYCGSEALQHFRRNQRTRAAMVREAYGSLKLGGFES
ncbi:unnamed protein product [Cladocopium goreaui]|uniref:Reverse transcriptase domain-containing protein n=1 Tax=Cladocopium goreaui TaxID=2562237 RepID=A0A9P1CMV3_9DINO|nr:unnamed protein product [Cladocopium goreaui]